MTSTAPVNLLDAFGFRFRIGFDAAYDPTNRPRRSLDPWAMTIPCRYGDIYPHGGTLLVWECERSPKIRGRVAQLPSVIVDRRGDDFLSVLFDVTSFDQLAAIVRPKRRRGVTAVERLEKRSAMDQINRQSANKRAISEAPRRAN